MTTTLPPASPRGSRRSPQRLALLASVCVLALSTCAGGLAADSNAPNLTEADRQPLAVQTEVVERPRPESPESNALRPPPLPAAQPLEGSQPTEPNRQSVVASDDAPEIVFDPVATLRPRIRLEGVPGADDPIAAAMQVDGVQFVTSVTIDSVMVHSPKGTAPVTVAAIDPTAFRVLTPQVTADAVDVWRRIVEGDAAFTHDVGHRLDLELGGRFPVGDVDDTLRVGAYASNGVPPIADAIVSRATARELGLAGTRNLFVAVEEGTDHEALAGELAELLGMEAELLVDPPTRRAFLSGAAARDAFEPFSYVSIGDGMIQIDQDWVRRNIVSAQVPIFRGNVICHRLLIPQLRGALQEIVERDLDHLIDPSQYGGCWVPRHILFNPRRSLSMHAWGLAVDFNVKGNEYGNRNPEMDPRIVEIFEKWGFAWGGHWSTPDGMHFELAALLQAPPN